MENLQKDKPPICQEENYTRGYKLDVFNWITPIERLRYFECQAGENITANYADEFIEVRFKNSRKDFFKNPDKLKLKQGDIVVTKAESGHDIGIVTLVGELVRFQMKKKNINLDDIQENIIYRKASDFEIKKWQEVISSEIQILFKAREIANESGLNIKICDVEYQGDKRRITFYFTADDRIDFRELIKIYAKEFKARIEMRQIGMRQEARALGGNGPCGRELCCATWNNNLTTVNLSSSRIQQLILSPMKLTGLCTKLKCCLNYELECYEEALKDFPPTNINLETDEGTLIFQKLDVYKKLMYYSYKHKSEELLVIPLEKVKEIIESNKKNFKPKLQIESKRGIINYVEAEQWSPTNGERTME